jgi:hypothetical protein
MKRFTNAGRNDQEGRELIPAHRNAGVEVPLSPSFEGGVPGARTYSRRQALGLLAGSLAGVSLLSLGVADPAKSTHVPHHPPFRNFDHIALESTGGFLVGRIQDGTVGLSPPGGRHGRAHPRTRTRLLREQDGKLSRRTLGYGPRRSGGSFAERTGLARRAPRTTSQVTDGWMVGLTTAPSDSPQPGARRSREQNGGFMQTAFGIRRLGRSSTRSSSRA